MIVILLEKVPTSLRGELSRWLLEPKTGVFVGRVSAIVREKLWQKCLDVIGPDSGGLLVQPEPGEQGFLLRTAGTPKRRIVDHEGIQLVLLPHADPQKAKRKMRLGHNKDTPAAPPLSFPNVPAPPNPEPSTETEPQPATTSQPDPRHAHPDTLPLVRENLISPLMGGLPKPEPRRKTTETNPPTPPRDGAKESNAPPSRIGRTDPPAQGEPHETQPYIANPRHNPDGEWMRAADGYPPRTEEEDEELLDVPLWWNVGTRRSRHPADET